MKILITGAMGFIGSNLVKRLLKSNHVVFGIDNFYSSTKKEIKHKNFKFYKHNIINPLPDIKVDQIYHLACPASPKFYQKNPIYTMDTNYIGTKNVLNLAKKYNATVLFSSTSEVYGEPKEHPQKESYVGSLDPKCIRACYDIGKKIAETLIWEYKRLFKLNTKIVRIFNTYGEGMNKEDGRVLTNFIYQAIENKDITIYGNGSQTRSFCYISDTLDALELIMNENLDGPINIGNPEEFSIKQVANIVLSKIKSSSKICFKNLPEGDPTKRQPDITKLTKLGWKPKISLDKGLSLFINFIIN